MQCYRQSPFAPFSPRNKQRIHSDSPFQLTCSTMSDGGEGKADGTAAPSDALPGLTGWSGVEEYLRRYDDSMMKVYVEDIDTLLVFAGLFSAVLTAFVVISFQSLQEDNSQIAVQLLFRISSQLGQFEIMQPFLNSTTSAFRETPFRASSTARWINILWFLSLVFSLGSALFGILTKQWIREYLQWAQVAASPRDNVLVRQLRLEAWNDWKVPTGISAIPALLELAVVLFLVGLVVLLWTVDVIVAMVITIATVVLLMIVFAVTILPAIFHRCPYKSPTGWAFVIIHSSIARTVCYTCSLVACCWSQIASCISRHPHLSSKDSTSESTIGGFILPYPLASMAYRFRRFKNWRERDLSIDKLASREIFDFADVGVPHHEMRTVNKQRLIQDICEVLPLVRALAWVRRSTEDPRLLDHVAKSAQTLHGQRTYLAERYYTFFYVMRKLCSINLARPQSLSELVDVLRSKAYKTVQSQSGDAYTFKGGVHHLTGGYFSPPIYTSLTDADSWILGHLLLGDTLASITRHIGFLYSGEKFMVLVSLLRPFLLVGYDDLFRTECRTQLAKMYTAMTTSIPSHYRRFRRTGIHAAILEILCSISDVGITDSDGATLITVKGPRVAYRDIDNEVDIAIQIFDQNEDYFDLEARHQFVMMADFVIRSLSEDCYASEDRLQALLQRMADAARLTLDKSQLNCGCYHDLPWIGSMLSCPEPVLSNLPSQALSTLLDVLEKSLFKAGSKYNCLITGEHVNENFAALMKRVEKRVPRSKPTRKTSGPMRVIVEGEGKAMSREHLALPVQPLQGFQSTPIVYAATSGVNNGSSSQIAGEYVSVEFEDSMVRPGGVGKKELKPGVSHFERPSRLDQVLTRTAQNEEVSLALPSRELPGYPYMEDGKLLPHESLSGRGAVVASLEHSSFLPVDPADRDNIPAAIGAAVYAEEGGHRIPLEAPSIHSLTIPVARTASTDAGGLLPSSHGASFKFHEVDEDSRSDISSSTWSLDDGTNVPSSSL